SPPIVEVEPPPALPVAVARLAEAVDCQWSDPRLPVVAGGQFNPGRLELVNGLARLTFADGADVILQAPCAIELHDPGRAFLHAGRLSAVVPPRARGFAIGAAGVNIIDLGTEFAVS